MNNISKSKIITYVVVAILIVAGLYWVYSLFIQSPAEPASGGVVVTSDITPGIADATDPASQFVNVLNDIDNIDLQNRLILSNKMFTSLKDFGREISDRMTGRDNPFAPLSGAADSGLSIKKATTSTTVSTSSNVLGE